ncbi:MAG: 4-hydroxy-tetrahydrodipicolinate synthase [Candidatus Cloacimonadota bacterium]|nr:4-hydroxy-tetrahydrodipicolinate synthase [Candidatus Cloacimonadota bacterium]
MIKGSYVALVTPFNNNSVDYNALEKLIEFQIANGTDGILLLGTTAESPTLAQDEKERIVRYSIRIIDGRVPVMVGTGSNNLNHTIAMTHRAEKWGADSALIITPYYNKPTQNGLYHYFAQIAKNVDIPIVIYNVPGRTGVNIDSSTTTKLANGFDNIVAIKEASGNIVQVSEIVRDTSKEFSVMSGEDALNMPILMAGAKGFISVTANILPKELHSLYIACEKGDKKELEKLHLYLVEINKKLFIETNPIPVKYALSQMGKINNDVRLPLFEMDKDNKKNLVKTMKKYKLI